MNYRTLIQIASIASISFAGNTFAQVQDAAPTGPCGSTCQTECIGSGPGAGASNCFEVIGDQPVIQLSEAATNELIKMRIEEKLARDVYAALGDIWNADVFRITNAESRHMFAMEQMLKRFNIDDPILDQTPGVFPQQAFTDLYEKLIESGSKSLMDALKVGAKIEELDLFDLRVAAQDVEDPILIKVYGNLQRATRNHLRAFDAQIQLNNGHYKAQHLSQEEYDTIAASDFERGMPNKDANRMNNKTGNGQAQRPRDGSGKSPGKGCGLCKD
ncbi:MAG: DUF2202 domain-containing protein [Phycisphaerales bacterium]|nr:DUF2202 domain-containing protein [Phycisphaerales bacterium]